MGIVHKSFDYREYDPELGFLPDIPHSMLFGWTALHGKKFVVDNTWSEEYWDGDGYSTRTHGSMDKYYPVCFVGFDNIKDYEIIEQKIKLLDEIKAKRKTFAEPVITKGEEEIARIRGTYHELHANWLERRRLAWAEDEADWKAISAEYTQVAREIFFMVYPTLEWPGEFFVCNRYPSNDKKLNKPFLKAVKKLQKEIEQINGIRAARVFASCDDQTLLSLPKPVLAWLSECYKNKKYKESNFFDAVWTD